MNTDVKVKFAAYPTAVRKQIENVRGLILQTAIKLGFDEVEESLKWGEASYRVKGGTTVRVDWKANEPEVIKVYFHCQTRLVETFRTLYPHEFSYEGNRALLIPLHKNVNRMPLEHCIRLAFEYHKFKHLPLLGAGSKP